MSSDGEWIPLSIKRSGKVVAVAGELDIAAASQLADMLRTPDGHGVSVDLSGVSFMDPAGLRVLLTAKRDVEARGGQLVVLNTSWQVRRLAILSGTAEQLGVEDPAEAR
jgi:anti-sigma B factor antagonist